MEMGTFWGDCTFPPILNVRETLAWRDPWAACLGQLADGSLEQALGAYPVDDAGFWTSPNFWDAEDLAFEMEEHPCVWTDGS